MACVDTASLPALVDGLLHAIKLPVCLMAGMSAVLGHVLFLSRFADGALLVFGGVFLLATGGCCFNILQEREIDINYDRTRSRSRSIGILSPALLIAFACLNCLIGVLLLAWCGLGPEPPILGVISLVLYNAVYTPLKKVSCFALIPGGVAGALPPVIGWTAGGGSLLEPLPVLVFVLFFLWQIPHFSLILLTHADDYRLQGVFKNLATSLSEQEIKRITAVWLFSLGTCVLCLTVIPGLLVLSAKIIITGVTIGFLVIALLFLFSKEAGSSKKLFIFLNGYFFLSLVVAATGVMSA